MLKPAYEIVILTKPHRLDFMRTIAPDFKRVETPYKEFTFGEQLGFKKQIESLKPDLVHFAMVQQPVQFDGRVVTTMHDLTTLRFKNPSKNPVVYAIKQTVYKWVNKQALYKSRKIIAISNYTKKDLLDLAHVKPEKIRVIYESADKITEPAQAIKSLEGKKFIMYIGRPTPHKNLGFLINAFKELQAEDPDLFLVLAGKKDIHYENHAKRVAEEGIKNVIFTGFVSDAELKWLYQHTACYVFPSLAEGFGLPGLEAMIHGAPVASSNATCLPEIYGDAAQYFDPTDLSGGVGAIHDVLYNKNLAKTLVEKGFKQVSNYSWQQTARETLEVYAEALSSK